MTTSTFNAPDIECGACANAIKKALGKTPGVSDVVVDVDTKNVSVTHDESVSPDAVKAALDHAGFPVAA